MRLNRLDLTRYGRFTDLSLSFGAGPVHGPDLHVIYGPNEAGKSTLLEGWLDLLFQIPPRSQMAFLHAYGAMQLGAAIEIDGQVHEIVRIKKPSGSLLDTKGVQIGEAPLQAGLRGLDRGSYSAMFSLDGTTLAEGGESILASQGDLGQLLFSASAGLSDLTARLDGLRAEAEEFLSPSGRKGKLLELKTEFDRLGEQIKALDTAAGDYARLARARDDARTLWQTTGSQAEAAIARSLDLATLIDALPLADRLHKLERRIAGFADLPVPPPAWVDDLPEIDREETEFATRIETATQVVEGLETELRGTAPDSAALDRVAEIAATEVLKSGYDTALADLPRRSKERDAQAGAIAACLTRLGRPGADPAALLPEARVSGSLRGLIEERSGVTTARATAMRELEDAEVEAETASERLREAGGGATDPADPAGLAGLAGLVPRLRRDDPVGTLDRARLAQADAAAELQGALADLTPWTGDATALLALPRPDVAWLDTARAALAQAEREAERSTDEVTRLTDEIARTEARPGPIGTGGTVTLGQAAEVRAGRENLWRQHRAALTVDSADRFETAMRLDDQITAAVSDLRARAEKAAEADAVLAEKRQTLLTATLQATRAQARLDRERQSLANAIAGVSDVLPADLRIEAFEAWLVRCDAAKALARKAATADRLVAGLTVAQDRDRSELLAALAQAGCVLDAATGLSPALETAQALLDREARIAGLQASAVATTRTVARRRTALAKAQAAEADWQSRWIAACGETFLGDTPPDVPAMRAILDELADLRPHLDKHAEFDLRIRQMQENRDRFAGTVTGLLAALGMAAATDAAAGWNAIVRRLRAAEEAAKYQARLRERLVAARAILTDLDRAAALHRRQVAEILAFFDAATWAEARQALTRAGERADLIRQRDICAEDLCARLRTTDVAAALDRVHGQDATALQAKATTLKADQAALDATREEAYAAFREAARQVEAVGGDGAVARLVEARQTLLLEIEDGARAHLRRRLGILAVDTALRQYRDTHRSGMLERASEAFRIMSRDRYCGLAAQPDGKGEVLVALAVEGGSKTAPQLSDGTRAQLYLALRIAGYHEFVRANAPVPFVADDIMESFDDDRTVEALGLLAEMSRSGQVIYLTHHAHVCAIARAVCPQVRLHELKP